MSDTLSNKEIKRLNKLGEDISISLNLDLTDLSNIGIPCRTDRLEAVKDMKEYLEIHNYKVEEKK
jgi:Zn-finger domain-containing protein|tara:strand:- start:60 stop:254 length:195 start_codon:yes stop_codon:yes gene_type:complete